MNRFSFTAQRAKREGGRGRKAANSIFHFPASPSSWPVPRPLLPRNVLLLLSFFLRSVHPSVAPSPVRVNEERERGSKSSLISAAGKCQTDERRESYQIFGRRVAREREGEGEVGLHLLPSPFANTRQRASERDRVRSPLFSRPRIRIPSFRSLRPEASGAAKTNNLSCKQKRCDRPCADTNPWIVDSALPAFEASRVDVNHRF